MKKLIFVVLAIMVWLGVVNQSVAQRNTSATMEVRVRVVNGSSVEAFNSFDLSQAFRNKSQSDNSTESSDVGRAGFGIKGEPGENILVKFPESVQLSDENGRTLTLRTRRPVYWNDQNSAHRQEMAKNRFDGTGGGEVELDEETGRAFIQFGGDFDHDRLKKVLDDVSEAGERKLLKGVYVTRIEHF